MPLLTKIIRNHFIKLIAINLILCALFIYYNPQCEPCINDINCPPCLSKEQYYTLYFGTVANLIFGVSYFFRQKRTRKTP